jgi:hypothetical protein
VPAGSFLNLPAVVPDPVHGPGLLLKMLTGGRILDPVAVGQHHVSRVVDKERRNKTDAKYSLGVFTLVMPSAVRQNSGMFTAMRPRDGLTG